MRRLPAALLCAAFAAGCGGNSVRDAATAANSSNAAASNSAATSPAQSTLAHGPSSGAVPPVASGHGAPPPAGSAPPAPPAASGGPDTSALDARIEQAVARAKAPGASAADKRAAAAAYMERGNVFWSAGMPVLYRRALADFNSVLLYQPDNSDAQAKRAEIIRIYQSMGRPVPDYSNEK